jgi:hypothetical protein
VALALAPNLYQLEALLMMTNPDNQSLQYWYIAVPREKFPQPKFHYGQQVRAYWEAENSNLHYEIGEIIGMQYGAFGYRRAEWSYLIRLLKSDLRSSLVGSDDGYFVYESELAADDTVISH